MAPTQEETPKKERIQRQCSVKAQMEQQTAMTRPVAIPAVNHPSGELPASQTRFSFGFTPMAADSDSDWSDLDIEELEVRRRRHRACIAFRDLSDAER